MAHPELDRVAKRKQRRMGTCPKNSGASAWAPAWAPAGQIQTNLHVDMTVLK